MMNKVMLIAVGGALGALARYYLAGWVQGRAGGPFPFGTLAVNLIGCFILGALMALTREHPLARPEARVFIGVGIVGAFTTFSTFGLETSALLHDGMPGHAGLNIVCSLALGLLAVEAGRLCTRLAGW